MSTRTTFLWATGILAAAGAGGLVISRYRRDLRAAQARLQAGRRVIDTSSGPVEYGASGAGGPVLVIHGAAGGFDQGADDEQPFEETIQGVTRTISSVDLVSREMQSIPQGSFL